VSILFHPDSRKNMHPTAIFFCAVACVLVVLVTPNLAQDNTVVVGSDLSSGNNGTVATGSNPTQATQAASASTSQATQAALASTAQATQAAQTNEETTQETPEEEEEDEDEEISDVTPVEEPSE
jgi:hypothetical protein